MSAEVVEFLERSATFEYLDAEMLDSVLERTDGAQMLNAIRSSGNLFLIPLDDERRRFRYHHLFREVLKSRLSTREPDVARRLDSRASVWLERAGDLDGAVRDAVNAREEERAGESHPAGDAPQVLRRPVCPGRRVARAPGGGSGHPPPSRCRCDGMAQHRVWRARACPTGVFCRRAVRLVWAPGGRIAVLAGRAGHRADLPRSGRGGGRAPRTRRSSEKRVGRPGTRGGLWPRVRRRPPIRCWAISSLRVSGSRKRWPWPVARRSSRRPGPLISRSLALYDGDLVEAERLGRRGRHLADRHHLDAFVPAVAVYAIAALVAARTRDHDSARSAATIARSVIARLGDVSPRTSVFVLLLLAQTAVTLGDRAEARVLVTEAHRARRRDASATFLNEQLDRLVEQLGSAGDLSVTDVEPLTTAELRVLDYLPTHLSLREIVGILIISRNTVKSHSLAIYRKLGASSRSDAVNAARRLGLLTNV